MMPATPIGRRKLIAHLFGISLGTVWPKSRRPSSPRSTRCRSPPARRRASRRAACPSRASSGPRSPPCAATIRSPTRRSTSPRAGAGVRSPDLEAALRRRDGALDVGRGREREACRSGRACRRGCGSRSTRRSSARTHLPAMKFWKVFVIGRIYPRVGSASRHVAAAARAPALRRAVAGAVRGRRRCRSGSRRRARPAGRPRRVGLRVAEPRQQLDRAEHEAPHDEQQRQHVRARRAMPPRPHAAPEPAERRRRRPRRDSRRVRAPQRRGYGQNRMPTPSAVGERRDAGTRPTCCVVGASPRRPRHCAAGGRALRRGAGIERRSRTSTRAACRSS